MTLRELVIEYRTKHSLSQRQFAVQCGVSNGYIAMLEKNLNPKTGQPLIPTLPSLIKISNGMGMTLSDLFATIEDMPIDLSFDSETPKLTPDEQSLLSDFRALNPEGQGKAREYVSDLVATGKYEPRQKKKHA